jgi:hypothetical protein
MGGLVGDYLLSAADDEEVRQGDLIRRLSSSRVEGEWGFVLTADCDIAQGKAGDFYTFLEIVPAEVYLNEVWAPAQLKRFVAKQAEVAADQLSGVMKRSSLELGINSEVLLAWLMEQTPTQIEGAVNRTGKPLDAKLVNTLTALHVALAQDDEVTNMDRLRSVRRFMGEDAERTHRAVREALEGERGFPDFFLLPELPGVSGYGFVVMLRAIRSLHASDLFTSELEGRIAGRPEAFYRVARTKDGVRFAITQKLTFLFSRIGLPGDYEDACSAAVALLVDTLVSRGR